MAILAALMMLTASNSPTVEDFTAFTTREQLHAYEGKAGNRVMWVETTKGVANIWYADQVHDSHSWQDAKPATNYSADDGMEISLFGFFTYDTIHYSRRDSDDVNPLHLNGKSGLADEYEWMRFDANIMQRIYTRTRDIPHTPHKSHQSVDFTQQGYQ